MVRGILDEDPLDKIKFLATLGTFHTAWASLDLYLAYGIGKFLKISHEDVHVLTAGWEFGRKSAVFRNLLYRKGHPHKAVMMKALEKIQNESARNAITHGVHFRGRSGIIFIDRSRGGDYRIKEFKFTHDSFADHVNSLMEAAIELEGALGLTATILHRFSLAAIKADKKAFRDVEVGKGSKPRPTGKAKKSHV